MENLNLSPIEPEDDHFVSATYKMFYLLEVRPIGVKKINICSMLLLDFTIFLTYLWMLTYSIFLFEN
jgi:hypothetical protein